MSDKSHRWELNPRPLGGANGSEAEIRRRFARSRGAETPSADPNPGRNPGTNDTYTTTAEVPRGTRGAPLRLLRDVLALPCRAVREGWAHGHLDLVPPDGPRAA